MRLSLPPSSIAPYWVAFGALTGRRYLRSGRRPKTRLRRSRWPNAWPSSARCGWPTSWIPS
eukprot:1677220-Alexandrium_andersonii.AAC.1